MVRGLIRILLLTFCLLILVSSAETPRFTYANNGDPDEVVERRPPPPPPPPPAPGPPGEMGDPDEVVEIGEDPFAPPMGSMQGVRGVGQGSAYWLVVDTMWTAWLVLR